jgi:hypothetical protein
MDPNFRHLYLKVAAACIAAAALVNADETLFHEEYHNALFTGDAYTRWMLGSVARTSRRASQTPSVAVTVRVASLQPKPERPRRVLIAFQSFLSWILG